MALSLFPILFGINGSDCSLSSRHRYHQIISMKDRYLVIDQGTSSTRVSLYTNGGVECAMEQQEISLTHPQNGWAELSPREIGDTLFSLIDRLLAAHPGPIASIGITNQRETIIVWDKRTGEPLYPAIVWLDRRTAPLCAELAPYEQLIFQKTGLCLDPYFSATKIRWILDNVAGARQRAARGELLAGTIDTFLMYLLSGKTTHVTDATNASRTMLYNIHNHQWDDELCDLFTIPRSLLPEVLDSRADFGRAAIPPALSGTPIRGVAGDQQAALIGQECFAPGTAKCTYGTGLFLMMNTGTEPVMSRSRLLATVAYRLDGRASYAIEGSSFVAGSALKWARDKLAIIGSYAECEALAATAGYNLGVYFVPAFHGLGAPYWSPEVRGALYGITQDTGRAELIAAILLASAYQTRDLVEAIRSDGAQTLPALRVDGGMTASNWFCQALADILQVPVERSACRESTSRGAALLAEGIDLTTRTSSAPTNRTFEPGISADQAGERYRGWIAAIERTLRAERPR